MNLPEIKVTNTATSKKELLVPLTPGKIKMYSCGPTVYGLIHIGNLRAALTSDMIYRYLKKAGYEVTYVRNYTDVDDKIINRAKEENSTQEAIAKKYTAEVEKDYLVAGLSEPTHKTTVTGHMKEIIEMIESIISNGKGYVVDGEVYFSISNFPTYGKLSRKNLEDLIAGARVEVDKKKKSPADFSLWKPAKPGEPSWDSPWGKGRPGWHIECSAMAYKHLGPQMDIHHGGEDLVFPHHENEIAQSEAATNQAPFVKYWMHNAFLNINAEKMSKSLGNVTLARDFLTKFGADITRMMLLSSHYRSIIDYNDQAVDQALTGLERIYEAKKKALELTKLKSTLPDMRAETAWGSFVAECEATKKSINNAYANDLNTPEVFGALFTLIRDFNRVAQEPRATVTPTAVLGAQALIEVIEQEVGSVLGIGLSDPERVLAKIQELRAEKLTASTGQKLDEAKINALIAERIKARSEKNFGRADEIRKELDQMGIVIKDGAGGTVWTLK